MTLFDKLYNFNNLLLNNEKQILFSEYLDKIYNIKNLFYLINIL